MESPDLIEAAARGRHFAANALGALEIQAADESWATTASEDFFSADALISLTGHILAHFAAHTALFIA